MAGERLQISAGKVGAAGKEVGRKVINGTTTAIDYAGLALEDTARRLTKPILYAGADHTVVVGRRGKYDSGTALIVPITQIGGETNWPNTRRRIAMSMDRLKANSGKLSYGEALLPAIPPGKANGKDRIIPTSGGESRQKLINAITGGAPFAKVHVGPSPSEVSKNRLQQKGLDTGYLQTGLRDLEITIDLAFLAEAGLVNTGDIIFPLGHMPLLFDENGELIDTPYKIGNTVYHPALMGMSDLTNVMSAHLRTRTKSCATIEPELLMEAIILASSSDEMHKFVKPHWERLMAIDEVSGMLAQDPGDFLKSFFTVFRFVDSEGNLHPDNNEMNTELANIVTGFETGDVEYPGNWLLFIKNVISIAEKNDAFGAWESESRLIDLIIRKASQMEDLEELATEMTGFQGEELRNYAPTPVSALLASSGTPKILAITMRAYQERMRAMEVAVEQSAMRALHVAQKVQRATEIYTDQHGQYWDEAITAFEREIRKLPAMGKKKGQAAGRATVQSTTSKSWEEIQAQQPLNRLTDTTKDAASSVSNTAKKTVFKRK